MATDVEIANMALLELRSARITSFTDGSPNQGLISAVWASALDYALALHPWNFAIRRVANQAARTIPPSWGWTKAYTVPANSIRVLGIGKGGVLVEGADTWAAETADTDEAIIVTNVEPPIDIFYIYRVTNTGRFSASFVILLVHVLKWMLARPITGKTETKTEAAKELNDLVKQASSLDGLEGMPADYGSTELEDVR